MMTEVELKAKAQDLLSAARNELDITWEDATGDVKLAGHLARGMRHLNGIAGAELDYDAEDEPRSLLFGYCRYARSNALEDFDKNYSSELLALHIKTGVAEYAAEQSTDV
jgi:hypothetical protein